MRRTLKQLRAPLVVLVLGLAIFFGGNYLVFTDHGYQVKAEFQDASGLVKASDVKVAGVKGGTVTSVTMTKRDTALVTMTLDPDAVPVGAGATATVRPVNLLGEKYVDLSPGDMRHPMPSGSMIPVKRTAASVNIDDILNVLDTDTRTRMAVLVNEAGVAMDGRGTDFNALLRQLPPSLQQARGLVAGLGSDNRRLAALIEQGDRVVASVNGKSPDLQKLVVNAEGTLRAVAQRRAQLGATIRNAPAALAQARTTLAQLRGAAEQLRPAASALRATAPSLARTLTDLPPFTRDAVPALRSVAQASPSLDRLSVGALPTVRRLRPTADRLASFTDRLAPLTSALDDGGVTRGLLDFMFGWARTIQRSDGLGHVFGLRLVIDRVALNSLLQRYGGQSTDNGGAGSTPSVSGSAPGPRSASSSSSRGHARGASGGSAPAPASPGTRSKGRPPAPSTSTAPAPGAAQPRQQPGVDHALQYLLGP